jgi:uncharacterized SAM-binding protein YcdF (DUF218 family)
MFWLKKLLGRLLMPLPLALLAMVVGGTLWFLGHRRAGATLFAAGFLWLAAASNHTISSRLVGPLEGRYAPIPEWTGDAALPPDLPAVRFIAVLGAGHSDGGHASATSRLSGSALARLVEAIRLHRHLPETHLILFGPGRPGHRSHAEVLREAALSLGVAADRIRLAPDVRDTVDEVQTLAEIAGQQSVALVTSAWHMPRAMALAERQQLRAVPCPADFAFRPDVEADERWWSFDVSSLSRSTKAVHEWLGLAWSRLRGHG